MCRILDVSTNVHYKWKNRTLYKRDQFNQILLKEIKKIHYQTLFEIQQKQYDLLKEINSKLKKGTEAGI